MAISAALKALYASGGDQRLIECLRIEHPGFAASHYLTNDIDQWVLEDELGQSHVWIPVPFQLKLPARDGTGRHELQVSIANVSPEMGREIEKISGTSDPIIITHYVFTPPADLAPQNDPFPLTMLNVQITDSFVSGAASMVNILNTPFPSRRYTTEEFPGLDR